MSHKRKFTWDSWNYDDLGDAYIIAKDECPDKNNVPEFIVEADCLNKDILLPENGNLFSTDYIEEGWCSWQCRTDWGSFDYDGKPLASYVVEEGKNRPPGKAGWFPVWIIRKGNMY